MPRAFYDTFSSSSSSSSPPEPPTLDTIIDWLSDLPLPFSPITTPANPHPPPSLLSTPAFNLWSHPSSPSQTKSLVLPSPPGTGKTTTATAALDHLRAVFPAAPIVHLILDDEETPISPRRLLATLALALASATNDTFTDEFSDHTWPRLARLEDHEERDEDAVARLVDSLLESLIDRRVFVVVDGLDKLGGWHAGEKTGRLDPQSTGAAFVKRLVEWQTRFPVWLLLTCEKVEHVAGALEGAEYAWVDIGADRSAVGAWVDGRMEDVVRGDDAVMRAEIKEAVLGCPGASFLSAKLALEALAGAADEAALREALGSLRGCDNALDGAYKLFVDRINSQPADRKVLAQKVLGWVVRARRALRAEEVLHTVAFNEDGTVWEAARVPHVDDVVASCAGLISVEPETQRVHLAHSTARAYFERYMQKWMQPAEKVMAMGCMTCMLQENQEDAFNHGVDNDWRERDRFDQDWPLAEYAARFWGDHARGCQDDGAIQDMAIRLLSTKRWLKDRLELHLKELRQPGGNEYPYSYYHTPSAFLLTFFGLDSILERLLADEEKRVSSRTDTGLKETAKLAVDQNQVKCFEVLLKFFERTKRVGDARLLDPTGPVYHAAKTANHAALDAALGLLSDIGPRERQRLLHTIFTEAWNRDGPNAAICWAAQHRDFKVEPENLFGAVRRSWIKLLQALVARPDMDPCIMDNEGRTLLTYAAYTGDPTTFDVLLDSSKFDPTFRDRSGHTALTMAVKRPPYYGLEPGSEHMVRRLLDLDNMDMGLHDQDEQGLTLLMHAARLGDFGIFCALLERLGDAALHAKDNNSRCIVSHAVEVPHMRMEILKMLVNDRDMPLNIPDHNGKTPLIWAAKTSVEALRVLMESKKDVAINAQEHRRGRTALFYLASKHNNDVDVLLADKTLNPNQQDHSGRTALWYAYKHDCTAVLSPLTKLLADPRTNPNIRDHRDQTLLIHFASIGEWVPESLLAHPLLDPNLTDSTARPALLYSVLDLTPKPGPLLALPSIDPNPLDPDGRTPLSHAAEHQQERAIEALLDHPGTLVDIPDAAGLTPLDYAGRTTLAFLDRVLGPLAVRFLHETAAPTATPAARARRARFIRRANTAPRGGKTLLNLALFYPHRHESLILALLAEPDIDVNSKPNEDQRTPLNEAVFQLHAASVRALLGRSDLEPLGEEDRADLRRSMEMHWFSRDEGRLEEGRGRELEEVDRLLEEAGLGDCLRPVVGQEEGEGENEEMGERKRRKLDS